MRSWTLALAAVLAACTGRTEAGPIGQPLELRQYLPDSLRSPTATTADSIFRQEIRVGPDTARVELTWKTFQHGSGRYLSEISARLVAPVRYNGLTLGNVSELRNSGTKFQSVESATVQIGWSKRSISGRKTGATAFSFNAGGGRTIGLPVPP